MEVSIHPSANLFPMLNKSALRELAEDIRKNGQQSSCVFYGDQLLDGRNRWKACEMLGIEPEVCEVVAGDDFDPLAYVVSHNLHRRHLTESQRSAVAMKLKKQIEGPAKERRNARLRKGKQSADPSVFANLPKREECKNSTEYAAKLLNVSPRSVTHATTVLDHGSPELIEALEQGKVAVSKAARIAKSVPKEEQLAAIEKPVETARKTPLDHLKFYWQIATDEEREAFAVWIG